ncbi:peroxiredoxin-like family protein [Shewanella sp. SR44-3]|uniref:peroxiredoxin-like family protein n=1 Tax=Shewanella sp. SR44-3 TaxID=2760936 RepID=UPI0015FE5B65|nr:peroxiredoxin-like family protein [Shewanella sp. SR44-3]MBB1268943.1 AhpC/TSA family protein [Shewanella sp. SR44-3]
MKSLLRALTLGTVCTLLSVNLSAKPIAMGELSVMPLMNGQVLPEVTLKDLDGAAVNLTELVGQKPTIFFFYRGGWCPFCNTQMGQLKAIEPKLIDMGFQLVGISPDTPAQLKTSVRDNKLDYLLLSDADMLASQAFGLAYFTSQEVSQRYTQKMKLTNPLWLTPEGDKRLVLPVPAVYLMDKSGLVHFQYVNPNFRVRPAPELILTAAELLKK